jgi:NAD(P)H-hydrate epimerase
MLPDRPVDGHKGLFGRVLIVGGSRDMIGAPMLAAEAAFRCGCGLVQVAMPRPLLSIALTLCPESTGLGLTKGQDRGRLEAAACASDVVVVGPGMGLTRDAHDRLRALIRLDRPIVLDADALNLLSLAKRWPSRFGAPAVLTPHPGEMRRLAPLAELEEVPDDDPGRIRVALHAAKHFGQVVVLKGHRTIVAEPPSTVQPVQTPRVYVNTTGDSSLSKAGTGDVLAGVIASLWAQGMERFDAACLAVFLHGRAGEIAGERLGRRSVLARDVVGSIPAAFAFAESRRF